MLQPAGTSTHFRTYATTELLTILFTTELARRLAGSGVTANAADPGFARTGLGRDAPAGFRVFLTLARPFQLSATKAADTPVHLATTPSLTEVSGGYFSKRRPGTPSQLARSQGRRPTMGPEHGAHDPKGHPMTSTVTVWPELSAGVGLRVW